MNQKRVIIFSGGSLSVDFLNEIQSNDFIIGADRGALFLIEHGLHPDISVGDFDSVTNEEKDKIRSMSGNILSCDPIDKALTDTELAFEIALKEKPTQILIIGGTGTRLDHTLANIQMLKLSLEHHTSCMIMDANNCINITNSILEVNRIGYTYVSLLPLTLEVTGITLKGFEYPLTNATLTMGHSLGISNRLIADKATVSIQDGLLLVIQSKD
ncbi:thiamine pyrophosphokinase [Paenibacillus sp. DS2015]|uniref:thiamine diphosphokinase n=1 Tax=Paenibacillus sp. DS2015 TaxID=3373917 RepID=UPI003D240A69